MEKYSDFMQRICSFEVPLFGINEQNFVPSDSAKQKISLDRGFKEFYGDTVVFDLSDCAKAKVYDFVETLYAKVPYCFSQKLSKDTMHLTLHDLSNSPRLESVSSQMDMNYLKIKSMADRKMISNGTIKMRSNYVINMVNTSVVMCFYPVDENEYDKIMYLYSLMDEVISLPYPFTPHVTLAYFNPNGFDEELAKELVECVNSLNRKSIEMTLTTDRLVYQRFSSMNQYETFLTFIK